MQLIKHKNKRFTLVEVMVSLAILVIMMGFLFEFVIGAQKVWSANRRMAKLFSNAQIVFKWLEQDANNAVYQSDEKYPGRQISFLINFASDSDSKSLVFMVVAEKPLSPSASTVQYFTPLLYYIESDGNGLKKLYREELWNFLYLGKDSDAVPSPSAADADVLIDGIVKIKITPDVPSPAMPSALKIEITLCDYDKIVQLKADDAPPNIITTAIEDTSRTFSKIIFLNRKQE